MFENLSVPNFDEIQQQFRLSLCDARHQDAKIQLEFAIDVFDLVVVDAYGRIQLGDVFGDDVGGPTGYEGKSGSSTVGADGNVAAVVEKKHDAVRKLVEGRYVQRGVSEKVMSIWCDMF